MFLEACRIAREFTFPFAVSHTNLRGDVRSELGAFIVINATVGLLQLLTSCNERGTATVSLRIASCFCSIGLLVAPFAQSEPTLSPSAPLLYSVSADSETVDSWSLGGLTAGLIGEAYRKSHESSLATLRSSIDDGSKQQDLLIPFACLGIDSSTDKCRPLIVVKKSISDQELIVLLQKEPTRSARVVDLRIIFDGRFFQVPTGMYDVKLTDGGALLRNHELNANYITTYSRKLHQEDIAAGRNETPFDGKVGSKKARAHFWHGGSLPRLSLELNKSVQSLADLWAATMSPEAVGVFAGDHSGRASLPRVRDLVAGDSVPCKTLHGKFLVAKDLGDYLWLVFPGKQKDLMNQFFIEPRCGFDY